MEKEVDVERSCIEKVRYKNYVTARASLRNVMISYGDYRLEVYECRFCKGYHIGHPIGMHSKDKKEQ